MLEKVAVEDLLMMYTNRRVQQCHHIISDMNVDYKEQVVITSIKSGMQCFICQVSSKKRENLCKTQALRIHENMRTQIALQDTEE